MIWRVQLCVIEESGVLCPYVTHCVAWSKVDGKLISGRVLLLGTGKRVSGFWYRKSGIWRQHWYFTYPWKFLAMIRKIKKRKWYSQKLKLSLNRFCLKKRIAKTIIRWKVLVRPHKKNYLILIRKISKCPSGARFFIFILFFLTVSYKEQSGYRKVRCSQQAVIVVVKSKN